MGIKEATCPFFTKNSREGDNGFEQRLALWDALLAARWPFLLLRWLWSVHNGPDRVRLSMREIRVAELRRRLAALIDRAEGFYGL